jgi:hypothetical protein
VAIAAARATDVVACPGLTRVPALRVGIQLSSAGDTVKELESVVPVILVKR